jgi:hypothetical protein
MNHSHDINSQTHAPGDADAQQDITSMETQQMEQHTCQKSQ